ncbi:hypothetical protein G6N76_09915 [Rhizobium daejeonense]|uniref:Uncharacterized protein n=1 Tax=Rhizobium daejeonense TaxID=240521 RepID=A0A6M1S4A8_9HYPH|nr:hypothetical protein [Rhizobium daejeonense]NGO63990.1 hypothetical protein [Rhizobium daejeonense]
MTKDNESKRKNSNPSIEIGSGDKIILEWGQKSFNSQQLTSKLSGSVKTKPNDKDGSGDK